MKISKSMPKQNQKRTIQTAHSREDEEDRERILMLQKLLDSFLTAEFPLNGDYQLLETMKQVKKMDQKTVKSDFFWPWMCFRKTFNLYQKFFIRRQITNMKSIDWCVEFYRKNITIENKAK